MLATTTSAQSPLPTEHREIEPPESGVLPAGTTYIGDVPVPLALQYDPKFLALPRDAQLFILQRAEEGTFRVQERPIVLETEKHSVRLWPGQFASLSDLIKRAPRRSDDARRSLTANSLVRAFLEHAVQNIAPHIDWRRVETEQDLRVAVARAWRKSQESILP